MKVTIKQVNGTQSELEVEPSDNIADVKDKIVAMLPDLPREGMRLIFRGRILKDDQTVEACSFAEGNVVVCMPKKGARAAAPPAAAAAAPSAAPAAAPAAAPSAAPSAASGAATAAATPAAPAPVDVSTDAAKAAIAELTAMAACGEDKARRAYVATNGNLELAGNLLLSGQPIPDGPPGGSGGGGGGADAVFSALRAHPAVSELRRRVQADPSQLAPALQALVRGVPGLAGLLSSPEQRARLVALLNEPAGADAGGSGGGGGAPPGARAVDPRMLGFALGLLTAPQKQQVSERFGLPVAEIDQIAAALQRAGGPGDDEEGGGGGGGGGGGAVQLTAEDMAAVERLQALGFSRQAAAEALLVCDRDEQRAANFLFENGN